MALGKREKWAFLLRETSLKGLILRGNRDNIGEHKNGDICGLLIYYLPLQTVWTHIRPNKTDHLDSSYLALLMVFLQK